MAVAQVVVVALDMETPTDVVLRVSSVAAAARVLPMLVAVPISSSGWKVRTLL